MKLGGHSSAARRPASPQPTLYERNLVNPWQERIRLVNAHRLPADAPLAKAIEESFTGEMWRFVLHEGLARTVVAARADGGRLEMHLAIEGSTDGTELVRVNAAMVGGLQIWNQ